MIHRFALRHLAPANRSRYLPSSATKFIGAALFIAISALGVVQAATSVSHYGITWSFSSDRPTGTFANGEPWVIGPVTITNINPNPSQSTVGKQNGSMKNPIAGAKHGFDSSVNPLTTTAYDPALNLALNFPFNLLAGNSLVSSKTVSSYPNYFDTVCVLTVLASAPPEGSFRPGPYGNDRTIRWNKSQINYSVLKNLTPVSGSPTKAAIEAKLPALPWWEWSSHYTGGLICPWRNVAAGNGGNGQPSTYGREIAFKWGEVGLWLHLNNSQADKEKAMIQSIQCGIDIWSYATNGGAFYHDGGHKCGRKFPVFLAAVALNDPTLLAFAARSDVFQEDTQTFFVTQGDVGRPVDSPSETYNQSHVGMAEWGVRHRWEPNKDDSRWTGGTPYRHVVWPAMGGAVLAAKLTGRSASWGHPAIFAFTERYKTLSGLGGFAGNMWAVYNDGGTLPPLMTVTTPSFSPVAGSSSSPQIVTITSATAGAAIRYTTDDSIPTRSTGTLYTGPISLGVGTKTLKAIAYNGTDSDSSLRTGTYIVSDANQVSAPVSSPAPGSYLGSQTVTLGTSTAGATIRYTTNGATPDSQSAVYSSPLLVAASTTVKAIAIKSGMSSSFVLNATYSIGSFTSNGEWQNASIPAQAGAFTCSFDVVPSAAGIDAVTGISSTAALSYPELAVIVRFAPNGVIDARDGSGYRAENALQYLPNTRYRVVVTADVPTHRYSVTVTPSGQAPVIIATNYAFRTEQSSIGLLGNLAFTATSGSSIVSNVVIGNAAPAPSAPTNLRIIE